MRTKTALGVVLLAACGARAQLGAGKETFGALGSGGHVASPTIASTSASASASSTAAGGSGPTCPGLSSNQLAVIGPTMVASPKNYTGRGSVRLAMSEAGSILAWSFGGWPVLAVHFDASANPGTILDLDVGSSHAGAAITAAGTGVVTAGNPSTVHVRRFDALGSFTADHTLSVQFWHDDGVAAEVGAGNDLWLAGVPYGGQQVALAHFDASDVLLGSPWWCSARVGSTPLGRSGRRASSRTFSTTSLPGQRWRPSATEPASWFGAKQIPR
jgi:hypothetical protein